MIDYLMVIYHNYDLLYLQIENFRKRFDKKDYRLIVVDNTTNGYKKTIGMGDVIDEVILINSTPRFDGVSHGSALDIGLQFCKSKIVCIIDSDFFILNSNITSYVLNKFDKKYRAVGAEWNDGKDTFFWVNQHPENHENIPCCFCAYYDLELARTNSWVVDANECNQNASTGFVEVGWRIRKHILDNKIKTLNWKTDATSYGNCYFRDEKQNMMGVHYVAGSHRRWSSESFSEIKKIIHEEYA